jgi:hypothetical protein
MERMNLEISECHWVIVWVVQEGDEARDEAQRASLANSQPRRVVLVDETRNDSLEIILEELADGLISIELVMRLCLGKLSNIGIHATWRQH